MHSDNGRIFEAGHARPDSSARGWERLAYAARKWGGTPALLNVGIHDWIDVASGFGLIAVTVIAVLLGSRLSRSEALREKVNNHGERNS
jgi:hypothetical protein